MIKILLGVLLSVALISCIESSTNRRVEICKSYCQWHGGMSTYSGFTRLCVCDDGHKLRF